MASKYSEKLKDPRWQKKRLEILQRDQWACQKCFDNESTLHVHHRRYIPERDPWDYPDELLITLCESCHEIEQAQLSDVCDDLISIIRSKFFSDDIRVITTGFFNLEVFQTSGLMADVIEWILSNKSVLRDIQARYFVHLNTKLKE